MQQTKTSFRFWDQDRQRTLLRRKRMLRPITIATSFMEKQTRRTSTNRQSSWESRLKKQNKVKSLHVKKNKKLLNPKWKGLRVRLRRRGRTEDNLCLQSKTLLQCNKMLMTAPLLRQNRVIGMTGKMPTISRNKGRLCKNSARSSVRSRRHTPKRKRRRERRRRRVSQVVMHSTWTGNLNSMHHNSRQSMTLLAASLKKRRFQILMVVRWTVSSTMVLISWT